MSIDRNKQLIRRLMDAHERHDVAVIHEILSPQLKWHVAGAPEPLGREEYLKGMDEGHAAFSDQRITIDDLVGEGDRIASRTTVEMRHSGRFQDIDATHRKVTFASVWFYRIVESHVVEAWLVDEDFLTKLRAP